jgi:hypothetical protein
MRDNVNVINAIKRIVRPQILIDINALNTIQSLCASE